jgi:hypothetical protein
VPDDQPRRRLDHYLHDQRRGLGDAAAYQSETFDGVGGTPQVNSAWNAIASAPGSALTVYEWE